jgi:diguanylate cyclase (GGDEF)-like protein
VANRRAFFDALAHQPGLTDRPLDIAIVDLDAFKSINDCHGHSGGDLALVQVARWLVELCGPEGLVARMGGDEFAVARPVDTAGERPSSARFDHDGMRYSVTLGWAQLDGDRTLDEVLRLADAELYAHKPAAVSAGHG